MFLSARGKLKNEIKKEGRKEKGIKAKDRQHIKIER